MRSLSLALALLVLPLPAEAGVQGVVCAQGDWTNGWAFVALGGRLHWLLNRYGVTHRVEGGAIPQGARELMVEYTREHPGGGPVQLLVDGAVIGESRLPADLPFRWQIGGAPLRIGADAGFPVTDDYEVPFPFSGTIERITFELPHLAHLEPEEEAHAALASD